MRLELVALLVCVALCSGCSTVVSHALSKGPPPFYAGTWLDSHMIKDAGGEAASDGGAALLLTYGVIDFPFSLVGDTICLPYDLTMRKE